MNKPLFSIVIPTYNRADFIPKTIQSLLNQSFEDFEVIVVDDGSTDNTDEVIGKIKDHRLSFYKKNNAERAAARNYGAKLAKGTYVNFFDSDDIAYSNHLEEAQRLIGKYNKPECFHLAYDWATPEGKIFKKENKFKGKLNKQLVKRNIFSCNGVFIRTDIALENPFNEDRDLSASEDWELWLRLAVKYQYHYSNTITSQIIDHDGRSVFSINKDKLIKRKELFLKYTLGNPEVKSFIGSHLREFKANAYSYIALHLILAKHKEEGLKYFKKSLASCPKSLFTRRGLAIIKHWL